MTSKKKILVVEDNWINRAMLVEILSDTYTILEAEDGQVALDVLKQHGDDVAVILLDLMMPVMDGYGFLERYRASAELSLIPVIVMTQSDSEEEELMALRYGATEFVPKPYRPQIILHRVASIIKLRENAAMANQFKYDRLTGLFSREYFYQRAQECLQENPNTAYSMICANIENFKVYNDSFGRKAGDRLLQEYAASIRAQTQRDEVCGRYGADRFLILRRQDRPMPTLEGNQPSTQSGKSLRQHRVVVKWGVCPITDPTVPVAQLCDWAFLAVASIKGKYNCRMHVYDDTLRNKLLREQAIVESMETALQEGQFVVYFQPKYHLVTGDLAGAEALVRWVHPQWGFISPGEFIPLFEKNGFVTRLDLYIWEQVCMVLRDWRAKGYPPLAVSVNVSRLDIFQLDLVETFSGLVEKYGIEPAQLHLELTESAYTAEPEQMIETVAQLRKRGFILEMDDFGNGYSSLNLLSQTKLDILKMDRALVQSETGKTVEQSILPFLVSLAHWMNMRVVAEGVETQMQMERLREAGCDYAQGYHFARPMPVEACEELLKRKTPELMGANERKSCGWNNSHL